MNDTITEALTALFIIVIALFGLTGLLRIYNGSAEMNAAVNQSTLSSPITKVNTSANGIYDVNRRMLLDRYETASEIYIYKDDPDLTVRVNGIVINFSNFPNYSALLSAIPSGQYSRSYTMDIDGNVTAVSYTKI